MYRAWGEQPDGRILGSCVLRGQAVPVLDLGAFLTSRSSVSDECSRKEQGPARPAGRPARFVSLLVEGRSVALAVDAVESVTVLDASLLGALPGLLTGAASGAVERLAALDGGLLAVLSLSRLVPAEVWSGKPGSEEAT
ncbi:MAG: chemotaxis protein CheW [Candidatus Wallbacteria bacterium]|nr:chemotaxis protein CheW [Candidatus Wallbacteria bacterium]